MHERGCESRTVVGTEMGGRRGPYGGCPCVPCEGIEWMLTFGAWGALQSLNGRKGKEDMMLSGHYLSREPGTGWRRY